MQAFTQFALPATIVASAAGAIVLCVILFFYGFRSEDEEGLTPARRLFVVRLGHAIAAACFAAALMLGSVALIEQRRIAALAAAEPTAHVRRLEAKVGALEQRLAVTDLRLGDAVQQLAALESRPALAAVQTEPAPSLPPRPARSPAPPRRPSRTSISNGGMAAPPTERESAEAMAVRPAESTPNTVPASASASEDLSVRFRDDWRAVKDGFRQAGDDVRSSFTSFGRQLKRTFTN